MQKNDIGMNMKCEFTKAGKFMGRKIETTYEIDLDEGTVSSSGFYFVTSFLGGKKSSFVKTNNLKKLAEMLEAIQQKQKIFQNLSGDGDRYIFRANVDDIKISIPGFQKQSKLIMHLGGIDVEVLVESGITGIREYLGKQAAFEGKIEEIKK